MTQQETEVIDFFANSDMVKPDSYREEKQRKVVIISSNIEQIRLELQNELDEYHSLLHDYVHEYGIAVEDKQKRFRKKH